jgi:hypothetical protein
MTSLLLTSFVANGGHAMAAELTAAQGCHFQSYLA